MLVAHTTSTWPAHKVGVFKVRHSHGPHGSFFSCNKEPNISPSISPDASLIKEVLLLTVFNLSIHLSLAALGSNKTCNGVPGLCDLKFNEVTLPGSHNSGAYTLTRGSELEPWKTIRQNLATSQTLTFREQLEAGVRAFDIEPCCEKDDTYTTVSYNRNVSREKKYSRVIAPLFPGLWFLFKLSWTLANL